VLFVQWSGTEVLRGSGDHEGDGYSRCHRGYSVPHGQGCLAPPGAGFGAGETRCPVR
jgi:hypothetical protein